MESDDRAAEDLFLRCASHSAALRWSGMRRLFLTLVCVLGGSWSAVMAGISGVFPWARLSDDETRILVVRIPGGGASRPATVGNLKLSTGEEINFLARFPKAGVYRIADGALLYRIDWYCLERELKSSAVLVHLARLNRLGGLQALTFFEMGRVTANYPMDELLTALRTEFFRPFKTWDYYHAWCDGFELQGTEIVVTTVMREVMQVRIGYSERHRFDFRTGTLIETKVRSGWFLIILAVGVLFLTALFVQIFVMARRRRRRLLRLR